ncbi:HPr family phosphocarrier protein [Lachnospiraceae bacterium ZAX-1]
MKSFTFVIRDELGIHARPAGLLVKEVKRYRSTIKIKKGDKTVSAEQLLAIMGLCAKKHDEVEVTVEGTDEEAAYTAIESFFNKNL